MIPQIVLLVSVAAVIIGGACAFRGRFPRSALAAQGMLCAAAPVLILLDLNRMAQAGDTQGMIDVLPAWLWGCIALFAIIAALDVAAIVRERRGRR